MQTPPLKTDDATNLAVKESLDIFRRRWDHWRPGEWEYRVAYFVRHGLTPLDIDDALTVTLWKSRDSYWRYFCGVCWRKLEERSSVRSRA